MTLPLPIYNVYVTCKSGKSKYTTFSDVIRPLVPFSLLFFVSVLWASYSKTDVLSQDPRVYFFTVGTIFSNISVSRIDAETKVESEQYNSKLLTIRSIHHH